MTDISTIRRGFADISFGQVHYRMAGEGPPLLLCHASPGSAKQLESLIAVLAKSHRVIAPDTPGNGDSSRLPIDVPVMADYARALLEFLDRLDLDRVVAYGTHTGAGIVAEAAIAAPDRFGRLILDGVPAFSERQREDFLLRYADPFPADLDGAYLMRAFSFCRDQFCFFPWYARDDAHRRDCGLPPAQTLHDWLIEVLKANDSYHFAYRAAFAYPGAERLALLSHPVLALAASDDPLRAATIAIAQTHATSQFGDLPRYDDPAYIETLGARIRLFATG